MNELQQDGLVKEARLRMRECALRWRQLMRQGNSSAAWWRVSAEVWRTCAADLAECRRMYSTKRSYGGIVYDHTLWPNDNTNTTAT